MPLVGMHLRAAHEILAGWRSADAAPFEIDDGRNRSAFLHGSLGPDMGFFPGGARRLSELVHESGSGDVTRALLASARNDVEKAFALGWCTHVLLDAHVHPLINRHAGVLSGRGIEQPVELLHMHQRVEMGLDIAQRRFNPCNAGGLVNFMRDAGFIIDAFAAVYDFTPDAAAVLASHRSVTRWTGPLLALESVLAASVGGNPECREWAGTQRLALAGVHGLRLLIDIASRPGASARAFLRPIEPDSTFRQEIRDAVARFHEEFHSHVASGLDALPNYNLDDGTIMDASPHTAVA